MRMGRDQMMVLTRLLAMLVATILLALTGDGAWSQAKRTIKIVVPFAAGGGADILARMLADQIGGTQQVTMIIENRPGAGTVIGTEAVSRAAPEGNTLLIVTDSFVVIPHLRKLNYDPLVSFEPVCNLAATPQVIVVNSASPYRTLTDLIDAAHINARVPPTGGDFARTLRQFFHRARDARRHPEAHQ